MPRAKQKFKVGDYVRFQSGPRTYKVDAVFYWPKSRQNLGWSKLPIYVLDAPYFSAVGLSNMSAVCIEESHLTPA